MCAVFRHHRGSSDWANCRYMYTFVHFSRVTRSSSSMIFFFCYLYLHKNTGRVRVWDPRVASHCSRFWLIFCFFLTILQTSVVIIATAVRLSAEIIKKEQTKLRAFKSLARPRRCTLSRFKLYKCSPKSVENTCPWNLSSILRYNNAKTLFRSVWTGKFERKNRNDAYTTIIIDGV